MALTSLGIWLAAQHVKGDAANPVGRNATARQRQRLTLWENKLQHLDQQLHPGVFTDGQQGDDFTASSHQDGKCGESRGIHDGIASIASLLSDLKLDQPLLVIHDLVIYFDQLFFNF